jgi:glutamate--cysteine ligase catalytic subunit
LICQGVDDRTDDEQNPQSTNYICKSRYSPAYSYISDSFHSHDFNNDYPAFPINKEYYDEFIKNGMSAKLSQHFANVLVRDPLVIFSEKIEINDIKDMTHFETINSSNWNSVRFKLPRVSDGDNCFKVEIRPCDLQMTPYENTSMIAFILGLHAIIMRYDTNFIMPISKVDINFERSYLNDAINTQKFYWRINSVKGDKMQQLGFGKYNSYTEEQREKITYEEDQENIKELTINEIINGCERYNYPGILHIVIDAMKEYYKAEELIEYIKFVGKRASGELWTGAKFVRNFIMNNKLYKHDSIIGQELAYELVCLVEKIQNGEVRPKEMFG